MTCKLRRAAVLALLLANGACATSPAEPVFEPAPVLHPPVGRIVFNRMCADEDPYRVKAYARMESQDGRARAVAAVLVGYRATGGKTVHIDVRIQRLKLDAGKEWRHADYTIRIEARSARVAVKGRKVGSYDDDTTGKERFSTDEAGTADWITFVEPEDEDEDSGSFYRFGPELDIKARDLGVERPQDEFDMALMLQNEANGQTLELSGPRVRIPERIWAMNPPAPKILGLVQTLNPSQEGGLFSTLGRAWKYRKCIEERKTAKRFLGPYAGAARGDDE